MTEGYNGFTNYDTWLVSLWLDNEQYSYDTWRSYARDAIHEAQERKGWTLKELVTHRVADQLKEHHEDAMHDFLEEANMSSSLWADLLGSALCEVNWTEIAQHIVDDVLEDELQNSQERRQ